jgi:hypothetical protein
MKLLIEKTICSINPFVDKGMLPGSPHSLYPNVTDPNSNIK